MKLKDKHLEIQEIQKKLTIRRNAKTAVFLGIASSGAFISAPALALTLIGSFSGLYLWELAERKITFNRNQETSKENT